MSGVPSKYEYIEYLVNRFLKKKHIFYEHEKEIGFEKKKCSNALTRFSIIDIRHAVLKNFVFLIFSEENLQITEINSWVKSNII
jgi:hypothetical protein